MRIDSPISTNAQITGSFSGSFYGDGAGISGVTAEWDGSHDGDASITGSLNVSANVIVGGTVDGRDIATDGAKLDGIETGATADQTAAEIKTAYESNADTNEFSDAEKSKLAAIEAGATGDLTGAEIKALYEAEANAFTDAQFSKLAGIESGATADQTGAEIKTAYEGEANTNAFTDAEKTKLAGLEAGAEVNVVTSVASKTGDVSLVKGDVGLGNVDNTSDADKPISTATQTALDLKAPLASPDFTGNPTAPTQPGTDDSTKLATTAFVQDRIDTIIGTAGSTLDTLGELSSSLSNDQDALTALTTTVGTKLAKASNLSDLANAATARTNLGVDPAGTDNSTLAGLTATAVGKAIITGSNAAAIRITLGVDAAGTNNYSHPTHPGDDFSIDTTPLTGATVISDLDINVTTDTLGHVTDANGTVSTRTLTLADLGYSGDANANNYSLPEATATVRGGIELFSNTDQAVAANAVSATAGRTYGIQLNSSGQAVVNVPWVDTNTTYTRASFIDQDVNKNSTVEFNKITLDSGTTTGLYFTDNPGGGAGDAAFIRYYAGTGESTKLHLSVQNDSDDIILLDAVGGTDVTGTLRVTGDVIAYYSSDERLKDNITPIEGALGKVEKLGGYEFDWNDNQKDYQGHDIGVIAQEVEAIFPELVATRDNGFKAVKYEKLTAVLLQAVKELSEKVKQLENK